jgi:hypothetical protein
MVVDTGKDIGIPTQAIGVHAVSSADFPKDPPAGSLPDFIEAVFPDIAEYTVRGKFEIAGIHISPGINMHDLTAGITGHNPLVDHMVVKIIPDNTRRKEYQILQLPFESVWIAEPVAGIFCQYFLHTFFPEHQIFITDLEPLVHDCPADICTGTQLPGILLHPGEIIHILPAEGETEFTGDKVPDQVIGFDDLVKSALHPPGGIMNIPGSVETQSHQAEPQIRIFFPYPGKQFRCGFGIHAVGGHAQGSTGDIAVEGGDILRKVFTQGWFSAAQGDIFHMPEIPRTGKPVNLFYRKVCLAGGIDFPDVTGFTSAVAPPGGG